MNKEDLTVIELGVGRLAMIPMPRKIGTETIEALEGIGVRPCGPDAFKELLKPQSGKASNRKLPKSSFLFCLSDVGATSHPCVAVDGDKVSSLGDRMPRGYDDFLLVEPIATTC